jgi:phosphoribosyl 1,2-cyclic phosphate phosphodiesterase
MSLRITILGCGSSGGVPRIGGKWGACDPNNPKNRRTRCSILVEQGEGDAKTSVLVDTSPDMREQLLRANVSRLDGVIYTHEHADQSHGIDDLRMIAINMMARVPVWADRRTLEVLEHRFDYCFVTPKGSGYPPILKANRIDVDDVNFSVDGPGGPLTITPFWQEHGHIRSLGFRFGDIAYTSDANGIPEESWERLEGVSTWIVDALRYTKHPSHANVEMALGWLERAKVTRGILTNLHVDLDYETLRKELPPHVEPAYDGMVVEA